MASTTMASTTQELWIQPTGAALGADVHGVDLSRPLDDATFGRIADAWSEHLVLRFSGQRLSDAALMAFSKRFGELDGVPIATENMDRSGAGLDADAAGWISVISNVKKNGKAIGGLGSYESIWHTDMSYNPTPPRASLLYALECPVAGGDTGFANMYLAYETLSADLKAAVQGKVCTHDSSRNSAGELRRGFKETADPRETPGAVHPLVRLHPVSKRPCLFLGRRRNAYVHGLGVAESETLLDALWAHASKPEFSWYQRWRVGDLMLWDNRCTMHRRDAFDDSTRRLMHRTQIVGEDVLAA